LRVVIAHDFMETYGGAERVTEEMAKAFPDAPVVAILGREEVAERMGVADRFRSLLPERASLLRHYRLLTPAFPALVDRWRLPDADIVLSSSYAFAHRLRPRGETRRVCYCHSPLRFAWTMTDRYQEEWGGGTASKRAFELLAAAMRTSDRSAAGDIDAWLTHSTNVADQIERFYGRDAQVIGAPVDCDRFRPSGQGPEDYFLFVGRLIEPYKRVRVLLEAFRELPDERLVIAGDGPALDELKAAAPRNVEFRGNLEDDGLVELMQGCRATLFPSRDDFGLVPVEVMACGRPVIAFAGGGAQHTVVPGLSGTLVRAQTADAFRRAVQRFRDDAWDPGHIRAHAQRWDARVFRERLVAAVEQAVGSFPERGVSSSVAAREAPST
jgi:glycosyltransferase involved in cell wall biosynthesis